jgi:dCTP deaminase
MSVVDLCHRATADWDAFNRCLRSSDSLIFFEKAIPVVSDPPGSIDLCVGSRWFDPTQDRFYAVEESGLQVKAHSCVVIEVEERLALPHNVMGFVTGKGRFIFQSALISTGKIDPGFDGRLRIGFFNASSQVIKLQRNDPFCSCCFLNTESEAKHPKRYETEPLPRTSPIPRSVLLRRFFSENWKAIIPITVSLLALLIAFFKK